MPLTGAGNQEETLPTSEDHLTGWVIAAGSANWRFHLEADQFPGEYALNDDGLGNLGQVALIGPW